jgi:two-component system cell cycle response regulator
VTVSLRQRYLHKPPYALLMLLLGGWAAFALHTVAGLGGADAFFNDGVYNALVLLAAASLLWRAFARPAERAAWLAIGTGVLLWALGELYYTVFLADLANPPYPSPADALYLAFYPAAYIGLGLLIRSRIRDLRPSLWLDGLIAALGLTGLAVAILLGPIVSSTSGSLAAVATNLAYPIGDMLLVGLAVLAVGLTGWRPGWPWMLIAAGLAVNALADSTYLYEVARSSYVEGGWLDALWPMAAILLAFAAWAPRRTRPRVRLQDWAAYAVPTLAVLIATGLLLYDRDGSHRLVTPALVLATATLLAAMVRMVLTFHENGRALTRTRELAMTDALTGLSNRRALVQELEDAAAAATADDPRLLILYDLDGFKHYNDSFGHPAGDALLERLAGKFAAAVLPYGRSYRLGGDEFCALLRPGDTAVQVLTAATTAALSEEGEGFVVTTGHGLAWMPRDADDASRALSVADRRLYLEKDGRTSSAKGQLRDVLMQVLQERQPELCDHLEGVAALSATVGRRLDLSDEDIDVLARAAELHDVGKMAIPDAILDKPADLTDEEWAFMHRHTILGERILAAAPAMRPVAALVRSSHERWDGRGYPDGLAGADIPLGSRIILVCDAYDAMTTDRPYRRALSSEYAFTELRAGRGTQFDPQVVDVFADAFASGELEARTAVAASPPTGQLHPN